MSGGAHFYSCKLVPKDSPRVAAFKHSLVTPAMLTKVAEAISGAIDQSYLFGVADGKGPSHNYWCPGYPPCEGRPCFGRPSWREAWEDQGSWAQVETGTVDPQEDGFARGFMTAVRLMSDGGKNDASGATTPEPPALTEARDTFKRINRRGGCGTDIHGWIDAWLTAHPAPSDAMR